MDTYKYRPKKFYLITFALTWGFWILAMMFDEGTSLYAFMLLGLLMPSTVAIVTVVRSGSNALKADFRRKVIGFYRIRPLSIVIAVFIFAAVVVASIGASVVLGGSMDQFSFTEDFSFSIGGSSALLTIILASTIEEVGWRGYGEDAVGAYHSWFKESLIFGCVWSCWHIPLFFVPGTYQYGVRELGILYVLNFLISGIPLDFIQTWVYVKNNRSMLATIIFHMFVNIMQEKIAMTPETKCIETIFITIAAVIIVLCNRHMFFETDHIGKLLEYQQEMAPVNDAG